MNNESVKTGTPPSDDVPREVVQQAKPVKRPERVLQFGEGAFLRAFVDWMVDILNEKTDFNGNVAVVQPLEKGMGDVINAQNGLYTTVLRGVADGEVVEEFRLVTSISRCVNVYAQFDEYIKMAENPDLRFVVSNTTEAGIAYDAADRLDDKPQRSFPGKVAAFLYRRWKYFNGDPSKTLVIVPCELIDKNGDTLREIVVRYAEEWNLEDAFSTWLEACDFCNSLVDRVVPGYPREEAETLWKKLGYTDNLLDAAEVFHLWVIETKRDYAKELPFVDAGLNVVWTDDMSFYRTRKVRILNGAHTMTAAAAFLSGLDTVEACCKDPLTSTFMRKGIFEEIIPSMNGGADELVAYADKVLERFANPYIKHRWLSITLNSISKFKTRVLPSIKGFLQKKGELPRRLVFSLAALVAFYEGEFVDGETLGFRGGERYSIKDGEDILARFAALYQKSADDPNRAYAVAQAVLSSAAWWGEDLSVIPGFTDAVAANLEGIWKNGVKAELERICAE
ncbi:MAG: tagaturonate reductase [Treponema sp.]|jgi:tagaturonate reductase|nr:tagaturonate reductase [Treponema sp.]